MPRTRFAPAYGTGLRQDLRVRPDEIRWRENIEKLPGAEGHHRLMTLADAAHAGGCSLPPFFHCKEAVGIDIEWERLPLGGTKAVVMRQRVKAWVLARAALASTGIGKMFGCRIEGAGCQCGLFAGRDQEVHGPVEVGAGQCARRQPSGQSPKDGMKFAIKGLQRIERWLAILSQILLCDIGPAQIAGRRRRRTSRRRQVPWQG